MVSNPWWQLRGQSLVLRNKTTLNRTYLLLWTFKETTPENLSRKSHLNEHQAMHIIPLIPHIQYTKAISGLAVSNSSFVDQTIVPLQWRKFLNSLTYMQHLYMLVCDHLQVMLQKFGGLHPVNFMKMACLGWDQLEIFMRRVLETRGLGNFWPVHYKLIDLDWDHEQIVHALATTWCWSNTGQTLSKSNFSSWSILWFGQMH